MASDETRRRVAHLLRRAGFGASPAEVERCAAQGVEATVDELVDYERRADESEALLKQVGGSLLDLSTLDDAQVWWLYRLLGSNRPLQEKMTLFWHGHFATANSKVRSPRLMHEQNSTFRRLATGNAYALTLAVAKDPAMLLWLDNATNKKAAPNENFSRELLELFTLGIGSFGEPDVRETARAFTGWGLTAGGPAARLADPQFEFHPRLHDTGPKTILGQTGNWDGDDALRLIFAHPAHAPFLVGRLVRYFAYDDPEPEVVEPLARLYRDSRYEIKPVLRALFRSEAFYSEKAFAQHIKSPVEFVVGAVRTLELSTVRARNLLPALAAMGQELYNPPHVGGWPSGRGWVTPSAMLERFNFATRLVSLTGRQPQEGGLFDPQELADRFKATSWEAAIDGLYAALADRPSAPALRAALLAYAGAAPPDPRTLDVKLRGLTHLLLTSAEAQLA